MKNKWIIYLALCLIALMGTVLRLYNLGQETIGHIEIYVPNIELPPIELSDPPPRLTLLKTISGPIAGEPHPPGFYLFMFGWTRLFGVSLFAIRLPIALVGSLSIILIFILGMLERDRLVGLLAAGMLAFNGHHLYWSGISRMYVMACFLGLLSTVLLLWSVKSSRWQWPVTLLYIATSLAGLLTVVFFWPLILTQLIWAGLYYYRAEGALPGVIRSQILTAILGSPLLGVLAFQSRYRSPTELSGNYFESFGQFLQFGFLLEPALFEPDPWAEAPPSLVAVILIGFLIVVALFLMGITLHDAGQHSPAAVGSTPGPSVAVLALAGLFALAVILIFTVFANSKDPSRNIYILTTSLIPVALPGLAYVLQRYWPRRSRRSQWFSAIDGALKALADRLPVTALLAVVPVVMIIGAAVFASRAALIYVPYLLVVLAAGLTILIRRHKFWLALLLLLIGLHGVSVAHYKPRLRHPEDYQSLAQQWMPQIKETDLIFVQRHWATTPIYYYLEDDRYNFVGWDYRQAVENQPEARVWVFSLDGMSDPEEMEQALQDFEPVTSVHARRVTTRLYDRH